MQKSILAASIAASLSLTACAGWKVNGVDTAGVNAGDQPKNYCQENPAICIIAGAVVVGGVTAIVVHNNRDDSSSAPPPGPSDARLKQDIRPVAKMNGVQLYAFRYLGDGRVFVGALAQDLLKDKALSQAVSTGKDGYYRVDYSKLGLPLLNAGEMLSAGSQAVRHTL